ncbi:hypothetical protein NSQ26_09750 [Bacillus sp. FSL W7-1360]
MWDSWDTFIYNFILLGALMSLAKILSKNGHKASWRNVFLGWLIVGVLYLLLAWAFSFFGIQFKGAPKF